MCSSSLLYPLRGKTSWIIRELNLTKSTCQEQKSLFWSITLCFLFMLFSIIFYLYCFFKYEWIFYRSWFNTTIMYYFKPCSFVYQLCGVQVFSDHHQLLDSGLCDVVVVSSPNMTHFEILMDIINHQKPHHVLVEKPLCTTVEDCKKVTHNHFNEFAILQSCNFAN